MAGYNCDRYERFRVEVDLLFGGGVGVVIVTGDIIMKV